MTELGSELRLVWFSAAFWLLDPHYQRNDSQMVEFQAMGMEGFLAGVSLSVTVRAASILTLK